jgi:phospholipase A1/A2
MAGQSAVNHGNGLTDFDTPRLPSRYCSRPSAAMTATKELKFLPARRNHSRIFVIHANLSSRAFGLALGIAASVTAGSVSAEPGSADDQVRGVTARCLMHKLATAADSSTVAELRAACTNEAASVAVSLGNDTATPGGAAPLVITQQLEAERDPSSNLYTITAHHPNYFLLAGYSSRRPSSATYSNDDETGKDAQKVEGKFQISLKALLLQDAFAGTGDLFVGYTQRSFWQMYNRPASSPFRETDFEPELWLRRVVNKPFLGWNVSTMALGLNHQSNGRGDEYSRSWNRVLGSIALERGNYGIVLRPWWRIPESDSADNNPEITKYMGNFDLTVLARYGKHSFDLMLRNNLKTADNHGAVQLGWTYPLTPKIKAYLQIFSGYGESLIDYNVNQSSIGAGLQLLDW